MPYERWLRNRKIRSGNTRAGRLFGSRQHGLPTLRIADLMADSRALYAAQKEALALVGADPALRSPGNAGLRRLAEELFSGDTALN